MRKIPYLFPAFAWDYFIQRGHFPDNHELGLYRAYEIEVRAVASAHLDFRDVAQFAAELVHGWRLHGGSGPALDFCEEGGTGEPDGTLLLLARGDGEEVPEECQRR